MIRVENICKTYGATRAVDQVSFEVQPGEIVGFLGRNGAGKSTTLKILTGYVVANDGKVTVNGYNALESSLEVRRTVGYLPETTPLYPDMQVGEYLHFMAKARQVPSGKRRSAVSEVVEMVGLERMFKKNIGHLSKGYRQRVGLAQALVHDPPTIILDEPTSGLDPHQIKEIRELIREFGKSKLVLLSSHILQEISAICSRLIIIQDGRIVANGSPEELQRQTTEREIYDASIVADEGDVRTGLAAIEGFQDVEVVGVGDGSVSYRISGAKGSDLGAKIFGAAKDRNWQLRSLAVRHASLEDVFLQLTTSPGKLQAAS